MQKLLRKYRLTLIGILLGTLGGYIYYHFWGCENGCAIKSSPWKMMLYGALMGGLLFNMAQDYIQKKANKK